MSDEKFGCEVPSCGFSATADRMWNLDERQATDRKRRIVCGKHAHEARTRHGIKAYRLSETLKRDAERQAERERVKREREEFFRKFANPRLADAFKRANSNGPPQDSPRQSSEDRPEVTRKVQVE